MILYPETNRYGKEKKEGSFYYDPNHMKWDKRFLRLAQHVSLWSKDPSTKVGAVLVDNERRIISLGFNGFPKNVEDTTVRLENRELKYKLIVHAEINAILFADQTLKDAKLYTYPFQPCSRCTAQILQTDISQIITYPSDIERWQEDFDQAQVMLDEANIHLVLYEDID